MNLGRRNLRSWMGRHRKHPHLTRPDFGQAAHGFAPWLRFGIARHLPPEETRCPLRALPKIEGENRVQDRLRMSPGWVAGSRNLRKAGPPLRGFCGSQRWFGIEIKRKISSLIVHCGGDRRPPSGRCRTWSVRCKHPKTNPTDPTDTTTAGMPSYGQRSVTT